MTNKDRAKKIAGSSKYIQHNIHSTKGFTWNYIRYRVLRPLLKLYKKWNLRGMTDVPWLTPAAIQILDELLHDGMVGLEYGSGKSTLFIASKIKELVSIEHHEDWFQMVSMWLKNKDISNVSYHLLKSGTDESKESIEIRNNNLFDKENDDYHAYFSFISTFPINHFDLILIDGRARVECCERAIDKLKSGGIFILDNSERPRYQPVHDLLKSWPSVNTTTGLTDTTFWFKP